MIEPTATEQARRDEMMRLVLEYVKSDQVIRLPDFDPSGGQKAGEFALQTLGIEPNPFGGAVGPYRYQFEGEEDLLHLIVLRLDGEELSPEEGQLVAGFVLNGLPPALIWLRPGTYSQHFYFGHDELIDSLVL